MNSKEAYEKSVEQIRHAGKAIIDNAHVMAGGYKYQIGDVDITITINPYESVPTIDVRQSLAPEGWMETQTE